MLKNRFTFYSLLPLFLSALSWELWAQSGAAGNPPNSGPALNRLIEISNQLSTLNGKLQSELQDSRQNSHELQSMLETSRQELERLKLELKVLQSSSTELLNAAENSQTELTALGTALKKAESSLMSLELSFTAYREASERKISTLSREKLLWKLGCIGAGVLAAGLGTVVLLGR